jgi:anti-sigma-K factor RskA
MSDDDTIGPADGGKILAAEYVLGVLSAPERREVERRLPQEPALASEVAFWEARLGALADSVAPVEPPPATWDRIETAIAAPTAAAASTGGIWQSLAFWRAFAIGSAAIAAACIAALAYLGVVPSARTPLMATLGGSGGQPNFVATVSGNGTSITVVPAALLTNDPRAIELWAILPGARPRSLGLVLPGQPIRLIIPPDLVGKITPETTLAVTLEPPGGSPTGQPTGPVIATGKLTAL